MTKSKDNSREVRLNKTIRNYSLMSAGVCLVPVPWVDIAGVTGLQLKMLDTISKEYNVEFKENAGKNIVTALLGGIVPEAVARGTFGRIVKMIPVVGPVAGAILMPTMAGASTYAVAKVFIQHFESGGTFLNFDTECFKSTFKEKVEEGKKFVSAEINSSIVEPLMAGTDKASQMATNLADKANASKKAK